MRKQRRRLAGDEGMDMDIVGVLQNGSRVLFDGTGVAGYKNVTRL